MLSPEERAAKNKAEAPERKAAAKAQREAEKAEREAQKALDDTKKIKEHRDKIYLMCEKALEGYNPENKRLTVWVDCKYMKKAAIDDVLELYKNAGWDVKTKFGDESEERSGPRWYLVFV